MTQDFAEFLKKSADTKALPLETIGEMYGVNGKKFRRHYRKSSANLKIGIKNNTPKIIFSIPKTASHSSHWMK
jgi:hypothetical protein